MSMIKRAFYEGPQGQVHYRYILTARSDRKPPVVFFHQSASCSWIYEPLMKEYALRGHDCYAPDMPGFGGSYDPLEDPTSTRFYVDTFMDLLRSLKLPKMHLVGHHAGAGMAVEMAAVYPDEVITATLSAPAFATPDEQAKMYPAIAGEWSKPKSDGSQLMAVWDTLAGLYKDLDVLNHEVLDTLRAWKGRDQAYKVLFKQDKIGFYKMLTCPILAMCSREDVLWPCFHYCSELQPEARCEVTSQDAIYKPSSVEGSIAYYHIDFLTKLGH